MIGQVGVLRVDGEVEEFFPSFRQICTGALSQSIHRGEDVEEDLPDPETLLPFSEWKKIAGRVRRTISVLSFFSPEGILIAVRCDTSSGSYEIGTRWGLTW